MVSASLPLSDPVSHCPVRVLHLVSGGTEGNASVNGMLLPLLLRSDRRRVQYQVVHFVPGHPHAEVVRQKGVPVHELRLSTRRGSLLAPRELLAIARAFRPDVVQAWGGTAQIAAAALKRFAVPAARTVWNMTSTEVLPPDNGQWTRFKLRLALRAASSADAIVYPSAASRIRHVRAGFPESRAVVIQGGVDVERYKPDFAARQRVREQLGLATNAFVIGMQAPFQGEFDHVTFLKSAGAIIRANPHTQILLAGRGVQKGNAPLMALVGGGTLATRVRLLGEWTDTAALFNACDVVCSTALMDEMRMTLAMAMLCGVPCVATGTGAQGEVVGNFGVPVEPGGEASLTRGITRIMEMPAERRAFLARGARQHAMTHFNLARSVERYLELYRDVAAKVAALPDQGGRNDQEDLDDSGPDQLTAA